MDLDAYLRSLRRVIHESLPGLEAQRRMAPRGRIGDRYHPDPPGARRSAVLLALFVDGDELALPVIERPSDGTVHSGQIALPGGAHEDDEEFPAATALREAREEIGLDSVQVIGTLSPLYIPPSNFSVHPVVGAVARVPVFEANPDEVARVIVIRPDRLDDCITEFDFIGSSGVARRAPCFAVSGTRIWGATAMILSEFLAAHAAALRGAADG